MPVHRGLPSEIEIMMPPEIPPLFSQGQGVPAPTLHPKMGLPRSPPTLFSLGSQLLSVLLHYYRSFLGKCRLPSR